MNNEALEYSGPVMHKMGFRQPPPPPVQRQAATMRVDVATDGWVGYVMGSKSTNMASAEPQLTILEHGSLKAQALSLSDLVDADIGCFACAASSAHPATSLYKPVLDRTACNEPRSPGFAGIIFSTDPEQNFPLQLGPS